MCLLKRVGGPPLGSHPAPPPHLQLPHVRPQLLPAPQSRTQLALEFRHSCLVPLSVIGCQLQQLGQSSLRKGRGVEEGQGGKEGLMEGGRWEK